MRVEDHNGQWRTISRREKLVANAVIIYAVFAIAVGSLITELSVDVITLRKRWRNRNARKRS